MDNYFDGFSQSMFGKRRVILTSLFLFNFTFFFSIIEDVFWEDVKCGYSVAFVGKR